VLDAKSGGNEALLIPSAEGGFEILVDPWSAASLPEQSEVARHYVSRRRLRFRIAHEIGHSFFYDRRIRPAKRLLRHSAAEEAFCDVFASALLVPQSLVVRRGPTAKTVSELSRALDVSAEMAGRALAKAHPGIVLLGLRPLPDAGRTFLILWSTRSSLFSTNTVLVTRRIAFSAGIDDAEVALELETKRGSFPVTITKLGQGYCVAVLRVDISASRQACIR